MEHSNDKPGNRIPQTWRNALDHRLPDELRSEDLNPEDFVGEPLPPEDVDRLTRMTMEKFDRRNPKRNYRALVAAAAVLLVVGGLAISTWVQSNAAKTEEDPAARRAAASAPVNRQRWDASRPEELEFEHAIEVIFDSSYSMDSRVTAMTRITDPICNSCVELRRIADDHPEWREAANASLDELSLLVANASRSVGAKAGRDGEFSGLLLVLASEPIEDSGPRLQQVAAKAKPGIDALHRIASEPARLGLSGRHFLGMIRNYVTGKENDRRK